MNEIEHFSFLKTKQAPNPEDFILLEIETETFEKPAREIQDIDILVPIPSPCWIPSKRVYSKDANIMYFILI